MPDKSYEALPQFSWNSYFETTPFRNLIKFYEGIEIYDIADWLSREEA
jgi:hypothetical protein